MRGCFFGGGVGVRVGSEDGTVVEISRSVGREAGFWLVLTPPLGRRSWTVNQSHL